MTNVITNHTLKGGENVTDSKFLRDLINKKGLKLNFVAKILNLTPYGLSLKIDNKNDFKANEIQILCDLLDIKSLKEKERIFFIRKSD